MCRSLSHTEVAPHDALWAEQHCSPLICKMWCKEKRSPPAAVERPSGSTWPCPSHRRAPSCLQSVHCKSGVLADNLSVSLGGDCTDRGATLLSAHHVNEIVLSQKGHYWTRKTDCSLVPWFGVNSKEADDLEAYPWR